jgi:hypothetical protein
LIGVIIDPSEGTTTLAAIIFLPGIMKRTSDVAKATPYEAALR